MCEHNNISRYGTRNPLSFHRRKSLHQCMYIVHQHPNRVTAVLFTHCGGSMLNVLTPHYVQKNNIRDTVKQSDGGL